MYIADFIRWIMGRSNNSHTISTQEFLNDSPTVSQQTGYVSQEGGTGVTRRGGTPWGMPGMSDTPNEFVLQSLDGSNRYFGKLWCHSYVIALVQIRKNLSILFLFLFLGLHGSFLTTQYTSILFQCQLLTTIESKRNTIPLQLRKTWQRSVWYILFWSIQI